MNSGFILTRQHFDTPNGVKLHLWVVTDHGAQAIIITQQEALCFIEREHIPNALTVLKQPPALSGRIHAVALKSFNHQPVSGIYFQQQRQLYEAIERLEKAGVHVLEKDIRPTERYLMERFIRAGVSWTTSDTASLIHNPKLTPTYYQPQFNIVSLDIETAYDSDELYCIGLSNTLSKGDRLEIVLLKGHGDNNKTIQYFPDEKSLLLAFQQWVQNYDPDIFIGWNVINFDFRFLARKFEQYHIPFNLGRNNQRGRWRQSQDGQQHFLTLPGRLVVDGIDSLKAATYHFESFSLEAVSRELLGAGKAIDDVENRGEGIKNLYHSDPSALAKYNLQDCLLVEQIFEKTRVMDYLIERAYLTGLPLDKYGGSTASFDNLYLPLLHRSGFVAPDYNTGATGLNAPGGYVMDSKPGLYDNVLVLDFKSLYPSIIRTFFIDPMGLAIGIDSEDNETDTVPGFNHAQFSRTEHHLPTLIDTLWQARDKAKKENNAAVSQAIKIIMNSFYGVLGSPGCRFFDQRLSSSITLRGHEILRRSQQWIEQQGYQVIYGDTDSVFVWISHDYHKEQVQTIGEFLQVGLNQWWEKTLADELNVQSHLEIEFETHYLKFFMPTIRGSDKGSKKRYCGQVMNADGLKHMVFKGLESVRTDWTPLARRFQQTLYELIFNNGNWQDFVKHTIEDLNAGKLDDELIYRKRLRRKLSDYIRNVPPHVQAARKADVWLAEQGHTPRYQRGGWIRYRMTLNGPEPLENSLSALDYSFYIERQLAPIAEAILPLLGYDFAQFSQPQITLL